MHEKSFVKLAGFQRPALEKNKRFGSEYDMVYIPGTWYSSTSGVLCLQLVARRRHLWLPRLPSSGNLLSAVLGRLSSSMISVHSGLDA